MLVGLVPSRLADEQEYRLTRYLMSNYDLAVRPSENASLPLQVKIHVLLQKIQQLVSYFNKLILVESLSCAL